MRQLYPFVTANRLEVFHSLFDFFFPDFHNRLLVKN
jgi:hypothetical protein